MKSPPTLEPNGVPMAPEAAHGESPTAPPVEHETVELALGQIAAESRGPRMVRYGLLVVLIVALTGITRNTLEARPFRQVGLIFYYGEFLLAFALLVASFSDWFHRRWEAIVLFTGWLLIAAMTAASVKAGNFSPAVLGMLLLQLGTAAFFPWQPSRQLWFNAATLASVAVFTALSSRDDPALVAYWVSMLAGAVVAQVACVASYRYRLELDRRLRFVFEGRERLAAEVREREKIIAQLRETQQELVVSREAALAASRARSEFLSSMSHEIRTPMNSVLGMSELLGETELNAEQRRYLDLIQSNGAMLLELINSILDLARMESGRLSVAANEFDLREMVEQVLDALAVTASEKDLELVARLKPGTSRRVLADSLRLRQVLTNLIGNAIKFTEHGQVVVTVEPDSRPGVAQSLRFSVADTGIGIPREKLKMIFEPFTQADSSSARGYGGSGLGLAIVTRLVALMGGELAVDSEAGRGSTFSFTIRFEPPSAAAAPGETPLPSLAGVSILVVDDNEQARNALCEMMVPLGARVNQSPSGPEMIGLLEKETGAATRYTAILLDASLPGFTLPALIEAVAAPAVNTSRIVMMLRTADLTQNLAKLRSAGLNSYVTKPVKFADLIAAVSTVAGISFPAPQPSPLISPTPVQPENMPHARVLIADDVAVNRALVHDMLRQMPFEIDDAVDGQDAVSKVKACNYDLVLMDMQMPTLDGYDATIAIRKWEREQGRERVPIIALTASALETDINRAVEAGCDLHLSKPFRRINLLKLLGDQLGKAQARSSLKSVSAA
ncbi:MAG: response regulator [Candidatus Binataceae bacterium]